MTEGVFELGDLEVQRGGIIRDAKLAWQTHGTLNSARDNVIVYPCSYAATHSDLSWLIGPDGILRPRAVVLLVEIHMAQHAGGFRNTAQLHLAPLAAGAV